MKSNPVSCHQFIDDKAQPQKSGASCHHRLWCSSPKEWRQLKPKRKEWCQLTSWIMKLKPKAIFEWLWADMYCENYTKLPAPTTTTLLWRMGYNYTSKKLQYKVVLLTSERDKMVTSHALQLIFTHALFSCRLSWRQAQKHILSFLLVYFCTFHSCH